MILRSKFIEDNFPMSTIQEGFGSVLYFINYNKLNPFEFHNCVTNLYNICKIGNISEIKTVGFVLIHFRSKADIKRIEIVVNNLVGEKLHDITIEYKLYPYIVKLIKDFDVMICDTCL